jgi:hypothetical protein
MVETHKCTEREVLAQINNKLDGLKDDLSGIKERLVAGDAKMSRTDEKVAFLEKIVYGTVGCVVLGVLGTAGTYLVVAIKKLQA